VLPLVDELLKAQHLQQIFLLDNSEHHADDRWLKVLGPKIRYIFNQANLGYGRAHNIALRESIGKNVDYHLVLNDDIRLKAADLDSIHQFMSSHPDVGCLMPRVFSPDGEEQYLAKLLPAPMDLFGRRFLPAGLVRKRNERFELRHLDHTLPIDAPYLSGCFMYLRTKAAELAGLFDERYFLYPEDIDLTRTIHRHYRTLYWPEVSIVHDHRRASYHSWRMTWVHMQNLCRYFTKWGWLFDRERRLYNHQTVSQIQGVNQ
jgi:hypothetical protein